MLARRNFSIYPLIISLGLHVLLVWQINSMPTVALNEASAPIQLSLGKSGPSAQAHAAGALSAPARRPVPRTKLAKNVVSSSQLINSKSQSEVAELSATPTDASAGEGNSPGLAGGGSAMNGTRVADTRALYSSQITDYIQRNLVYPRSARVLGRQGVVQMWLKIDKDGNILKSWIGKKSVYEVLNQGSHETIRQLGKLPPLPKELGLEVCEISVPITYSMHL